MTMKRQPTLRPLLGILLIALLAGCQSNNDAYLAAMQQGGDDCFDYCAAHYGADRGMQFDPTALNSPTAVCSCNARNNTPEYSCILDQKNSRCVPVA
jgi:hypothetical protein